MNSHVYLHIVPQLVCKFIDLGNGLKGPSYLDHDLELIKAGNSLEIIDIERRFEGVDFYLNEEKSDKASFFGFIDRIDRLNGTIRIIDYKTAKTKNLTVKIDELNKSDYFQNSDRKHTYVFLCAEVRPPGGDFR